MRGTSRALHIMEWKKEYYYGGTIYRLNGSATRVTGMINRASYPPLPIIWVSNKVCGLFRTAQAAMTATEKAM